MPELPEVETMCRGIAPIVGGRIAHLERPPCKCRPIAISPRFDAFRRRAEGKMVTAIQRVGKRVVIWLGAGKEGRSRASLSLGDHAIVIEPRMSGLVLLGKPPSRQHLRFHIQLRGGRARDLWFWDRRGLGRVQLLSADDFAARYDGDAAQLGPDALAISATELRGRLGGSRRPIKVALMDQSAVAGIGNLYASEMLHLAGIHPQSRCNRLTITRWKRLHAALRRVLRSAIRHEGSTLSDGSYRNALNESGAYQNHHRVYDRAGEPCPECRQPVRRIMQAQRSTFFCPHCQRR